MKTSEIRSQFIKYFEKQGHTAVESSSLVPSNDPTLLFTTAGMVQFKDVFMGKDPRPYKRAVTVQKCVRAGGKHNDLENVGFTARHHTFFEMLGNFSFGDYFKKEAIHYAWEFVTQVLKLPKDRLYVTVFETDDEAAEIWEKQEKVPRERIYRFGEADNFWAMGDTGPCGPCSEIFIDRGQKYSCGKQTCTMGCDCDRFMEFWNLVFMQYERDGKGNLTSLPRPSVDTGAGLERIASILQDVNSNYDTDAFQLIIGKTADLAGKKYEVGTDLAVSFRVVADHSRATAFLIGDGVMPSNEGRGYVLRRIIRRAIRHGKKLGFTAPFLHKTAGFVIDQMKEAYPDLIQKRAFIERAVLAEEEQFFKTLERGLALLDEETAKLKKGEMLSGEVAFKLYDTFGFPIDLTRVICAERGFGVNEKTFEEAMERQRTESRKHWKGSGQTALDPAYLKVTTDLRAKNQLPVFSGYEKTKDEGKCLALFTRTEQGLAPVDAFTAPPGDGPAETIIEAVFSVTPFYGESGGQMGDRGLVTGSGFEAKVVDVQRPIPELIVAQLKPLKGAIRVGSTYLQETDSHLRALTARNHTATHLLHWALREVLGTHVKQAGSLVSHELLRFDFSHFQALSPAELSKIETLINEKIWHGERVLKREMTKDAAISAGAIAFFGEKYGDRVRVVSVGSFSTELCGGTHVDSSDQIHLFKIASEGGIAAGVRRIIAYTSEGAFKYLDSRSQVIESLREKLKANSAEEVPARIEKMAAAERELRRQIEQLQAKSAGAEVDELLAEAKSGKGFRLVSSICEPTADGVKRLRDLADRLKQKAEDVVAVLGMKDPDGTKASLLVAVGPKAPKTVSAGEIIKGSAALIQGRGGGKPDLAQAGGTDPSGLAKAIQKACELALEAGK